MDRRAFLLGTVGIAGAVLAPRLAWGDDGRIEIADLRGTLGAVEFNVEPGAIDDQSATLQLALDRAAAAGKPLFLPPGRYEVSNLTVPSRLKIIGVPGETRIVYTGGGHLLRAEGGSGISLDGIVLDGANRALGEYASGLLHLIGVGDLNLERCEIVGSAKTAIVLERCAGRVSRNRMSGARDAALWSVNASGLEVTDNLVADCGDGGILIHRWELGEDGSIVARNRIERIAAKSGGTGQFGNGINVFRAGSVMISDNHIADCAFTAIRSNSGSNVQITGNQCLRSGETAIYSEFAFEGALIASNVIDGGSIGISVANFNEGGRLAAVTGNLIRNLHNGAPYPDEMGLDFGIGISVEADTAVSANVIEGAPSVGLLIGWGPFVRDVAATGNVIRNGKVGIGVSVVEGAGTVAIASNLISGARDGAIRGMRWTEFVTDDLALTGTAGYPHLAISENRVG